MKAIKGATYNKKAQHPDNMPTNINNIKSRDEKILPKPISTYHPHNISSLFEDPTADQNMFKTLVNIWEAGNQNQSIDKIHFEIINFTKELWRLAMLKLDKLDTIKQSDFFSSCFYVTYSAYNHTNLDCCVEKIKDNYLIDKALKRFTTRSLVYFDTDNLICLLLSLEFDNEGNYELIKSESRGFGFKNMNMTKLKSESHSFERFLSLCCERYLFFCQQNYDSSSF